MPPADLLPDWAIAQAFRTANKERPKLSGDSFYAYVTREAQRLVTIQKQSLEIMKHMGAQNK